jgi:hypothetical protein
MIKLTRASDMWTFKPAKTQADELLAELKSERKALRLAERCCGKLEVLNTTISEDADNRESELLQIIEDRDKMIQERDDRIEQLESTIRLRELDIRGLMGIVERDRQRVEAEAAVEVARAEAAALRANQQQSGGHHRAFIP